MHSNRALTTSMVFQWAKMAGNIMDALKKPDDQMEWSNIFQLMCAVRQLLACAMCGKLVTDPHTPSQGPCHCICSNCHESDVPISSIYVCSTCSQAQASQDGFKSNSDLNYAAVSFVKLCKLIYVKDMVPRYSSLEVASQNGLITFSQLILEGKNADNSANQHCLGDRFKKAIINRYASQKRKPCRCGSGKNSKGRQGGGALTCLGQRCTCYKEQKGCEKCKCEGCNNPHGKNPRSLNEPRVLDRE